MKVTCEFERQYSRAKVVKATTSPSRRVVSGKRWTVPFLSRQVERNLTNFAGKKKKLGKK
jgi:hypothetical protein